MQENKSNIIQSIKSIPFFFDISSEELNVLSQHIHYRSLSQGRYVFKQGDKPDGVYFMIEGKVKVLYRHDLKNEELLEKLEAPAMFGELALIDKKRRAASVVTIEEFSALVLNVDDFESMTSLHPEIGINIIRKIARTLSLRLKFHTDNKIGLI